jgi:hypothetical protein
MQKLTIDVADPPPAQREKGVELLAGVLALHADLRRREIEARHLFLTNALLRPPRHRARQLRADLEHVEGRLRLLQDVQAHPADHAAVRLASLLRLVGGPVRALELGPEHFAARVADPDQPDRDVRVLLRAASRPRRVQVQPVRSGAHPSPRCLGELGSALVDYSLDRLDLSSLVLTLVAYLNMNPN